MAFEQYLTREWKSVSPTSTEEEYQNGCFDCNICFENAHDPVITLCGHLYCWPCIYKWFHVQSASLASNQPPQCPVCKGDISHTTLVPLYGRGQNPSDDNLKGKQTPLDMVTPPRPPAFGTQHLENTSRPGQQLPYRNPYQNQHFNPNPYGNYQEDTISPPLLNLGGPGYFHPVVGMFGEMVYSRVFGNSESFSMYPNSYQLMGNTNTRLRRQEIQADKSLSRISFFLFCCFFLCLVLF